MAVARLSCSARVSSRSRSSAEAEGREGVNCSTRLSRGGERGGGDGARGVEEEEEVGRLLDRSFVGCTGCCCPPPAGVTRRMGGCGEEVGEVQEERADGRPGQKESGGETAAAPSSLESEPPLSSNEVQKPSAAHAISSSVTRSGQRV